MNNSNRAKLIYREGLFHGDRSVGSRHDGEIKDNGSELRIYEKLRTARGMKWAIWCEAQTPEISDEEETSEPPRDERKWKKEIQTEKGEGQGSSQERGLMLEMKFVSSTGYV